jgi:hypothetical protein
MFDFPMLPHGLFLTHEQKVSYLTQLKLCDTFLEMGQVNAAEKLASEILAGKRHSPLAVEKLAWINIIKGQTETARIYLNALKKDLVHRGTAQTLLDGMDSGFAPEQAAYIDGTRSRMFADEYPGTGNDPIEKVLTGLLDRNPHNKMALEYLMACHLLSGRVDKVAANVQRLNELGYETVPTLYEEAILIYVNSKEARSDPSKFQVQRTTMERYRKFIQLRNSMRPQNRQQVLRQLIVEFGNSYFFYFTFGCVGVV